MDDLGTKTRPVCHTPFPRPGHSPALRLGKLAAVWPERLGEKSNEERRHMLHPGGERSLGSLSLSQLFSSAKNWSIIVGEVTHLERKAAEMLRGVPIRDVVY